VDDRSSMYEPRPKPFRRKKVSSGNQIFGALSPSISDLERAKRQSGIYCRACKITRPWIKLRTTYEKQGNELFRLWWCECGNMIREDNMSDLEIQADMIREERDG
jgi:hypothetical protein